MVLQLNFLIFKFFSQLIIADCLCWVALLLFWTAFQRYFLGLAGFWLLGLSQDTFQFTINERILPV